MSMRTSSMSLPTVVAFLDIHPIRDGHVQVIPREHFPYFDAPRHGSSRDPRCRSTARARPARALASRAHRIPLYRRRHCTRARSCVAARGNDGHHVSSVHRRTARHFSWYAAGAGQRTRGRRTSAQGSAGKLSTVTPTPSIERTFQRPLRALWPALMSSVRWTCASAQPTPRGRGGADPYRARCKGVAELLSRSIGCLAARACRHGRILGAVVHVRTGGREPSGRICAAQP